MSEEARAGDFGTALSRHRVNCRRRGREKLDAEMGEEARAGDF